MRSRLDIDGGLHFDYVHGDVLIALAVLAQFEVARVTRVADQVLLMGIAVALATDLARVVMMSGQLHAFRSSARKAVAGITSAGGPEVQEAGEEASRERFEHGEADANQGEVDLDGAAGRVSLLRSGAIGEPTPPRRVSKGGNHLIKLTCHSVNELSSTYQKRRIIYPSRRMLANVTLMMPSA